MRLPFDPVHSDLDPSSGAALCTRELLELLAARGMDCRELCAGVLDHKQETSLDDVLVSFGSPAGRLQGELSSGRSAQVVDLSVNGVRVRLVPTASSPGAPGLPGLREGSIFRDLAEQMLDRIRPDVILTYDSHRASLELMRRALVRGTAVFFHLHNYGSRSCGVSI